jgi:preprotein translocase subunit SecD
MYPRSIGLAGILLIVAAGAACATLARHHQPEVRLELQIVADPPDRETAAQPIIKIIVSRLNALGLTSHVESQGPAADGRIVVTVSQTTDIARLEKVLTATGKLELAHVISNSSPGPCQTYATKAEAISRNAALAAIAHLIQL